MGIILSTCYVYRPPNASGNCDLCGKERDSISILISLDGAIPVDMYVNMLRNHKLDLGSDIIKRRTYHNIIRIYSCARCILDIDCDIYEYDTNKELNGVLTYDISGTKVSRTQIKTMMDEDALNDYL